MDLKQKELDSTGKNKIVEAKARQKRFYAFVLIGFLLGIIISERIYVHHGGQILKPALSHIKLSQIRLNRSLLHGLETFGQNEHELPPRNDLEAMLRKVAPSREVLVSVSNRNLIGPYNILQTFISGLKVNGVSNHLILALDKETRDWCAQNQIHAYLMNLEKAKKAPGGNHVVSAMKFGILRQFVELGWSVLLMDVDICILKNPFEHLYRDSDVEGMTDGFDERTAYGAIEGFDDPSMGWSRYAQSYRHFNFNSGLFYLRANERTLELLTRLEKRMSSGHYWDQTAYNEEVFFLSHGNYKSPQVSVRVMEIDKFMNSKRLFKDIRHRPAHLRPPIPVTVHVNYHPDKHARMLAAIKYYGGDEHALDKFPGGSEPGS